jgi:hypothetical protein
MAEAVYAIEDFPDDDLLWRIEWIGGVGYNTSVPSDPQIEICLAQLPAGETNPLRREITFLSNKENSENRRWPTALHFDCFGMVGGTGECYSHFSDPQRNHQPKTATAHRSRGGEKSRDLSGFGSGRCFRRIRTGDAILSGPVMLIGSNRSFPCVAPNTRLRFSQTTPPKR